MDTDLRSESPFASESPATWAPETPFGEWEEAVEGQDEDVRARLAGAALALPRGAQSTPATRLLTGVVWVKAVGMRQGAIAGDSAQKGREGWILGSAFEFEVKSPRDPVSGMAVGKRQHVPVRFTKAWSASSPQLFSALVSNEPLTSVIFEFPGTRADGTEVITQRVTLSNASISEFRHVSDPSLGSRPPLEQIALTFQTIKLEDLASGVTAQDDWGATHAELEFDESGQSAEAEAADGESWVAETYELERGGVYRSDEEEAGSGMNGAES